MTRENKNTQVVDLWLETMQGLKARKKPKGASRYEDTGIELTLQRLLREADIPFYTQVPLLGLPDIFVTPNIVIFADGCFYHGCRVCPTGQRHADRRPKDAFNTKKLEEAGFAVFRFWEHDINSNAVKCVNKVVKHINEHTT